ncbi:cysteine-rich receptor-like protein kinase 6 isoform X2 [Lolium rigidum]|uniref:cysteine-rich receptor-like protein kinase 6 isoform X2 n=1 Tax=Lolium rigidum TaxID=89674 RepID=UPI001F5E2587|nr:cysteine-rich receptor-like protein kinase 6 isoform X2 [Lolium rigidum]
MARHLLLVMVAVAQLVPRATGYPWPECGGNKTFKGNSKYQANLNHVAAMLPNKASASAKLFATAAAGVAPDRVWAMGLCRGDSDAASCFACLTQGFQDLPNDCSYDKEATIYYDACILHYSDARVLSAADTGLSADTYAQPFLVNITSDQARFNRIVADLMNATAEYAAYNSTRRFATGEADLDQEFPKVYSLAQCTPDQTPAQCRECLAGIIASTLADFFENDLAPRALWVNCNYRYEVGGLGVGGAFYNVPAMVRLASSPPAAPAVHPEIEPPPPTAGGELKGGRKYSVSGLVLVVMLPTLAGLNLVACLCFRRLQRPAAQAKQQYPMHSGKAEDIEMVDSMQIDVSTLRAATVDFAESNKLGEGGFGTVYKGVLPNGDEIAVKRLSQNSTQGVEELKNELALVAKLKHKNLVRLLGVCLEQQERLLVYELVPNRSLDLILFDAEQRELLDWGRRHKIINGIARGLQYLHEDSELKVVHRDLKASNILLDAEMRPKISDFGLARIFERDQTQAVTNRVIGTHGYMAPEYAMRGNYSVKSDAFSFGVMVVEIVTGRKNNHSYDSQKNGDLVTTVWEHWEAGTVTELVDPCMGGSFPVGDVLRCIQVGLLCVQGDPVARPIMSSVVMMLGSDTVSLQALSKPVFFTRNAAACTTKDPIEDMSNTSNVTTRKITSRPEA